MRPAPRTRLGGLPSDATALAALYRGGDVPDLRGFLRGRLLPVTAPPPLDRVASRLARSRWVPWQGKVLGEREGVNHFGSLGQAVSFSVRADASRLDGRPCLVLDYDRPGNPAAVRRVLDEVRRVGPGMFLGPSFVRLRGRSRLWLWFALADP